MNYEYNLLSYLKIFVFVFCICFYFFTLLISTETFPGLMIRFCFVQGIKLLGKQSRSICFRFPVFSGPFRNFSVYYVFFNYYKALQSPDPGMITWSVTLKDIYNSKIQTNIQRKKLSHNFFIENNISLCIYKNVFNFVGSEKKTSYQHLRETNG